MALGHLGAVGGQDVVVSEDVHTVIMPVGTRESLFPSLPPQVRLFPSGLALLLVDPLTHDTHATPRSGARPWA